MPRILPRIRRTRRGHIQLRLPAEERALLRQLAGDLRDLLGTEDPALTRLYPPGHASDPESDRQYRELVRRDLTEERLAGLQVFERTVDASEIDQDELGAWLGVLNDMRLVLGSRLEVTEEMNEAGLPPGDPRSAQYDVYRYLTWLEWQLVEVMAAGLPETGVDA